MGISKEKQIRMNDFKFSDILGEKYPKLTMVECLEIARLAAQHFNHNKYERQIRKMHREKNDLEETLTRKKQRLTEYQDAIIRRNEIIKKYEHCDCDKCIHRFLGGCDVEGKGWCFKNYGETNAETNERLAKEYMDLIRKKEQEDQST